MRNETTTRLMAAILCMAAMTARAQELPVTAGASDFSSVEYFDAPHEQQIKSRLSGAEAQPLPGGMLLVKQLKIETFDVNGKPQLTASAPECTYDPINQVANSSGELHMQTGDNALRIDGEGFLWRQSDSFLTISNQVQTLIEKTPSALP